MNRQRRTAPFADIHHVSRLSDTAIEVSVVVPALNEAANLPELATRIHKALQGRSYELLIVDDGSRDGTPEICLDLARRYPLTLHVRPEPQGGLSGAVLYGLERARGRFLVVMDADLQHPPERIAGLLEPLERGEAEFVIGSRYVDGGSTEDSWGFLRRANSLVATNLARPLGGHTRDPMSGFFALRRDVYARGSDFNPLGYKIALELMCKCRVETVREVPIHFGLRNAGKSKLNLSQQFKYLDHLIRLYDFCYPQASPWVKFVITTACAWFVGFSLYVRLLATYTNPFYAPTFAFAAAAVMSLLLHFRSLRAHGRNVTARRAWVDFVLVLAAEWSVCTLVARWVAFHVLHAQALQIFALTFGAAAIARYSLRKRILHDLRGIGPADKPVCGALRKAA